MSRAPTLLASGVSSSHSKGVVIVGGGSGAFHAVESLREVSIICLSMVILLLSGKNSTVMKGQSLSFLKKHTAPLIGICPCFQILIRVYRIDHRKYRTKLSKALIIDPAKIEWRTAADLKIKYGTNLRLGVVSYVWGNSRMIIENEQSLGSNLSRSRKQGCNP